MRGSFLDEIALGRYIPGNSPLHRTRPYLKALVLTTAAASTFLFQSATAFFGLGCVAAILSLSCQLPQRLFWRSLRPINLLAMFTILSGCFINHPGASFLDPSFSWSGLHTGATYAARLVTITLLTTLFLLTTSPQATISLGIKMLRPLRLLGIQQQELNLLVHLAYRFVPLLRREIREMDLGKRARNLPSDESFAGRLKSSTGRLVFLIVGALKRAETASFALEQRRVLENWSPTERTQERGWGGWMSGLLLVVTILLLRVDSLLL